MCIACVYIPRFAVEAERQRHPDIGNRAVLIGDMNVHDYSLGAETVGVCKGMRMTEAIALCSRAVVLSPDAAHYQRLFNAVFGLLSAVSPDIELGKPGMAYVSLSGISGDIQALAQDVISTLHKLLGFMASVGIASGKFTTRIAAVTSSPGGVKIVPSGAEAMFLAELPCTQLPASEAMLRRLKLLGLETIGDVANLPLGPFQQQFGPEGKRCWELARGTDNEPLVPTIAEQTITRRLQLPAPAVTLEAIFAGLQSLIGTAYGDKTRQGHWVRKVVARATFDNGGSWELPIPFREALADPKDAWFAVKNAVIRHPPDRPVEELEIELIGLSGESGKQGSMFENKGKLWRQVEEAARQMGSNGGPPVGRIVEVEPWSRIPERRAALEDFAR
jgi:DNA polymerase-4/protein ImuB